MVGEEVGSALWREGEGGDPSLRFCKYREQLQSFGFCKYKEQFYVFGLREQSLTSPSSQDPISSTGRVPLRPFNLDKVKFNLYNVKFKKYKINLNP